MASQNSTEIDEIVRRELAESMAQIVTSDEYTRGELHALFTAVQDKSNWKNPIRATVNHNLLMPTIKAIEFFAGCPTRVVGMDGTRIKIEADGYYAAVGA